MEATVAFGVGAGESAGAATVAVVGLSLVGPGTTVVDSSKEFMGVRLVGDWAAWVLGAEDGGVDGGLASGVEVGILTFGVALGDVEVPICQNMRDK